jgi:hypothetical protein
MEPRKTKPWTSPCSVLQETWKVTPTGVAIEELGKCITD